MEAYDYLLINDEIDACVEQMHQLITLQHSKTCYHLDFLSTHEAAKLLVFHVLHKGVLVIVSLVSPLSPHFTIVSFITSS